jgi:hypothetical protein
MLAGPLLTLHYAKDANKRSDIHRYGRPAGTSVEAIASEE